MSNDEPAFLNRFKVYIDLPEALRSKYPNREIWIEQVKKISGLETDKHPGTGAEQRFEFAQRRFPKSLPESTTVDLEMEFECNINDQGEFYPYNVFQDWSYSIYDPRTGAMGLKKDVVGSMEVLWFRKDGKVFKKYVFPEIWVSEALNAPELDYTSEDIFVLSVKFAADYFKILDVER
jgi:hypothetical protein